MTKKEKLIQNINELAPLGVPAVDDSLTMKELQGIYENLKMITALDPPLSKGTVIKTPDMDVSSVKAIHNKMRIINAKLKSTDLKDQKEGKADLEALTIKVREDASKIDYRTKFLDNV
jgi:hypothetical protein